MGNDFLLLGTAKNNGANKCIMRLKNFYLCITDFLSRFSLQIDTPKFSSFNLSRKRVEVFLYPVLSVFYPLSHQIVTLKRTLQFFIYVRQQSVGNDCNRVNL